MWEYIYIDEKDIKKAVEKLNELGKQNWEAFGYAPQPAGKMGGIKHVVLLRRQK